MKLKFRGKDNKGRWHYGWYKEEIDGSHWIREKISPNHYADFQIISETVGMSTGLHDKNGKEIFEGDIVHYDCEDGEAIAEIIFAEEENESMWMSGFKAEIIEIKECPEDEENPTPFEIIGNKWESDK